MEEQIDCYTIKAAPIMTSTGRWSVAVIIERASEYGNEDKKFISDDGISYILKEEAEKECLNLGRNLIKTRRMGL